MKHGVVVDEASRNRRTGADPQALQAAGLGRILDLLQTVLTRLNEPTRTSPERLVPPSNPQSRRVTAEGVRSSVPDRMTPPGSSIGTSDIEDDAVRWRSGASPRDPGQPRVVQSPVRMEEEDCFSAEHFLTYMRFKGRLGSSSICHPSQTYC
jgi:hypothetical protein